MATLYKSTILLLIASLSPASAGAFSSPSRLAYHEAQRGAPIGAVTAATAVMRAARDDTVFSLPLFLRGGQQDINTLSPEETGLDDSQKNYGTQSDEESAASVEMTKQSFEVGQSSVSEAKTAKHTTLSAAAFVTPLSSVLQAAATFYTQQLSARPILTKSATAAVIFGLSDWVAQLIERKGDDGEKEPIVLSRILSAFLVGLLFFGPAANAWYEMIFKVLPSTSLISTVQKAALGQIFFGPAFTCVFFAAGLIESGTFTLGSWISKIKNDLPGVWASGLGYWPLVDFISYKVIPVQWIPLFVNFCSFVWTIYLSLVANRSKAEG